MKKETTKVRGAESFPGPARRPASHFPSTVHARTEKEAINIFSRACTNLLRVNDWPKLIPYPRLHILLTDPLGSPIDREAVPGNFISMENDAEVPEMSQMIELPWMKIEKIEHHPVSLDYELFFFQMRPVSGPFRSEGMRTENQISMIEKGSLPACSIILERDGMQVGATVHGQNYLHWKLLLQSILSV